MVYAALRPIFATAGILVGSSRLLLAQDPVLATCLSWIHGGAYPNGIAQGRCEARFDLPDPFTITCLRRIEAGVWSDRIEQAACHIHLTDLILPLYGDYYDASTSSSASESDSDTSAESTSDRDDDLVDANKRDGRSE